jgi:hypothetical protein
MRKEQIITLQDAGESKNFKIRQMPATKAERWLIKFILLLGGNAAVQDMQNPTNFLAALADKPFDKVQELLDALLSCCSRVHDGGMETQLSPVNVDGFVEEITTLMKLRAEAFKINNFFPMADTNALKDFGAAVIRRKKG